MSHFVHILRWLAVVFVIVYLLFCFAVYLKPQWFFYNPAAVSSQLEVARANGYPAQLAEYKTADGTALSGWYTKPGAKRKIILFLHGNSYNLEFYYHKMQPFVAAGYGTFMPEYRGFGGIEGDIRQKNLMADTTAAVSYLHKLGYSNSDIVLYGLSLGTYMAVREAAGAKPAEPFSAVVLEVPFTSLFDVVKSKVWFPLPLNLIVRDKYDSQRWIKKINAPLLVMGAGNDELIPVSQAQSLYDQAEEPKNLIIYPGGGHNTLFNFRNYADIINWLEKHEKN